ncbi:MAG: hypothetical protein JO004_10850 [Methylobacteriaceae bacterium]|nr:hypothetical protein [Methylobacteriaceae bacterium]
MRKPVALALWGLLLTSLAVAGAGFAFVADPDARPVPSAWVCRDEAGQLHNYTVTTGNARRDRETAWSGLRSAHCQPGTSSAAVGSGSIAFRS